MVLVREVHESVAVMMGGIAAGVALLVIGVIFPSDRVWSIGLIAPLLAGLGGGLYATWSSWLLARRADQLPDLEFADRRLRRGLLFFALLLVTGVLVRAVGADVSSVGGGCLLIAFIIALTTQHLRRREIREGRVLLRRVDGRHKPESRSFTVPRSMWEDRRNAAKPTASPSS